MSLIRLAVGALVDDIGCIREPWLGSIAATRSPAAASSEMPPSIQATSITGLPFCCFSLARVTLETPGSGVTSIPVLFTKRIDDAGLDGFTPGSSIKRDGKVISRARIDDAGENGQGPDRCHGRQMFDHWIHNSLPRGLILRAEPSARGCTWNSLQPSYNVKLDIYRWI